MRNLTWLIPYYLFAFVLISGITFYYYSKEPYVNWNLYEANINEQSRQFIEDRNCEGLKELYDNEYNKNYNTNFLGFKNRKDKKLVKGQNLLGYLNYNIRKICT